METSEKIAWLSILINLTLVGIKATLAVVSGSLAIKADAIHSLSDVISSTVILIGIKISKRRTRSFPYGLYKVENLVALATSFLILLAGYEILSEVFAGSPRISPTHIPLATAGIGLTILITWIFSRYELKKGEETGSPSLVADARHIWTDMLSSLVILASLLGSAVGFALDRYAALIVVAFIGRTAFMIFLDAVRVLLDASLDHESLDRIRGIVEGDPRVVAINQLRARNAGRYKFVELDLTMRVKELEKGHRVSEEIKERVKCGLANVDHVLVHYEAMAKEHLTLAMPLADDRRTISEHFGEAPYFRVVKLLPGQGSLTSDAVLTNPLVNEDKAKGIKVAKWLVEQGLDMMIVKKALDGRGPGYVLGNAEVEVLVVEQAVSETALTLIMDKLQKSPSSF